MRIEFVIEVNSARLCARENPIKETDSGPLSLALVALCFVLCESGSRSTSHVSFCHFSVRVICVVEAYVRPFADEARHF
jgi:hypothetical protein